MDARCGFAAKFAGVPNQAAQQHRQGRRVAPHGWQWIVGDDGAAAFQFGRQLGFGLEQRHLQIRSAIFQLPHFRVAIFRDVLNQGFQPGYAIPEISGASLTVLIRILAAWGYRQLMSQENGAKRFPQIVDSRGNEVPKSFRVLS